MIEVGTVEKDRVFGSIVCNPCRNFIFRDVGEGEGIVGGNGKKVDDAGESEEEDENKTNPKSYDVTGPAVHFSPSDVLTPLDPMVFILVV